LSQEPTQAEVDGGSFRRYSRAGFLNVTFKELTTRFPAFFRADDTVAGYQDRLLGELPNFRNLAGSYKRLEQFAREAKNLSEARRRHHERRIAELRTNRIDEILGLPPDFPPPVPELYRITKLREWNAHTIKKRTPVPYLEIRVYVYTRESQNPLYSDGNLLRAIEAVQRELEAFSDPKVRAESFQETQARESEPVDEDELEEENRRQLRGLRDRIVEDEVWYYVAFYKAVAGMVQVAGQYYGRVQNRAGIWVAETPRAVPTKPSFSTTTPIWTGIGR
jgi:hypothetical protein